MLRCFCNEVDCVLTMMLFNSNYTSLTLLMLYAMH